MRRVRCSLLGMLIVAAASCVHAHGGSGANRNLITQEEIQATNAATAYDVIARLRSEFLRDRGPTSLMLPSKDHAVVFLRDQEYGTIDVLRDFRSSDVAEIRFYSGPDAVIKFGSKYSGGVIQLVPRVQ